MTYRDPAKERFDRLAAKARRWREGQGQTVKATAEPKPTKAKRPDPGAEELRKALEGNRKRKAEPAASERGELKKTTTHYITAEGREWVRGTGWVDRDDAYWRHQSKYGGPSTVLEVGDVTGPTVIDHPTYGKVVRRGCLVCGHRDVARPRTPLAFGRLRGGMCPRCHSAWEDLTVGKRKELGLFVFQRLHDEGLLPEIFPTRDKVLFGEHPIERWPDNWRAFVWAVRVLRSEHPELQEPLSKAFGFLSGKLEKMADIEKVST